MIHEILTPEICAKCKGCCHFSKSEEWEAPCKLIPPTANFNYSVCVHLTDSGCELGENKPLECTLYPFRVMRFGGVRVITATKYCKPIMKLSAERLIEFAETHYNELLDLARENPGIVKEYDDEYIILKKENLEK